MTTPIGPIAPVGGASVAAPTQQPAQPAGGKSFGDLLGDQITKLTDLQNDAAAQSQALATGKADDVGAVAMSVERASLALQVAAQVRNKAVEAYQEIFRMQV